MRNVGEAFSFYINYYPEMEMIYAEEDLTILDSKKASRDTMAAIEKIGNQASTEAGELLSALSKIMLDKISKKSGAKILRWRSTMENSWDTEIQIWPKELKKKPKSWDHTVGATINNKNDNVLLTIWCWNREYASPYQKVVERYSKKHPTIIGSHSNWDKKIIILNSLELKVTKQGNIFAIDQEQIENIVTETIHAFCEEMQEDMLKDYK